LFGDAVHHPSLALDAGHVDALGIDQPLLGVFSLQLEQLANPLRLLASEDERLWSSFSI
jgi:hypothetical protein